MSELSEYSLKYVFTNTSKDKMLKLKEYLDHPHLLRAYSVISRSTYFDKPLRILAAITSKNYYLARKLLLDTPYEKVENIFDEAYRINSDIKNISMKNISKLYNTAQINEELEFYYSLYIEGLSNSAAK
jgi:hypothetical protein